MILDYLRYSEDGAIRIPPFHTGHLGFIPGTQVTVSLMRSPAQQESHCEICATPFSQDAASMFRTEATMKDQIGVVHQLLAGIARLHINVVKEESSAINYLNHHQVDLVLDWRTSFFRDRLLSRPEILSRYAPLNPHFQFDV